VTSEYTDLESRLGNLEAAEEQLTRIMESAVKTEDVLNVYNQLVQTREQIEVIKGQMKYYEQSAAMSAVSVELIPNEAVQPLSIGGWQPVGVVGRRPGPDRYPEGHSEYLHLGAYLRGPGARGALHSFRTAPDVDLPGTSTPAGAPQGSRCRGKNC
jgi:hypothetical protein